MYVRAPLTGLWHVLQIVLTALRMRALLHAYAQSVSRYTLDRMLALIWPDHCIVSTGKYYNMSVGQSFPDCLCRVMAFDDVPSMQQC